MTGRLREMDAGTRIRYRLLQGIEWLRRRHIAWWLIAAALIVYGCADGRDTIPFIDTPLEH